MGYHAITPNQRNWLTFGDKNFSKLRNKCGKHSFFPQSGDIFTYVPFKFLLQTQIEIKIQMNDRMLNLDWSGVCKEAVIFLAALWDKLRS